MKIRKTNILFVLMLSTTLVASCSLLGDRTTSANKEPVARVLNKYLYPADLESVIGDNMTTADSTDLANHFIESWVRRNILLSKAEELLPKNQGYIEAQLKDYRESLFLFLFEQDLLNQNLDSIVQDKEIEKYYIENKENFELRDDVLKASFIVLKNESPQKETVKDWFKSGAVENEKTLEEYCYQYAINFSLNSKWYAFDSFINEIPIETDNPADFLAQYTFYETRDAVNTYFVKIDQYGTKGRLAPLDYKRQDIAKIIVNKRKMHYVSEIKDKIYQEALEKNQYEIY